MVVIVGALSDSHIPVKVTRDLLDATKPGQTLYFLILFGFIDTGNELQPFCTLLHFCIFPLGGCICLTTRSNKDNFEYKASLEGELKKMEEEGLCTCLEMTDVEDWERAVSEHEHGYISGVVYLYKKL